MFLGARSSTAIAANLRTRSVEVLCKKSRRASRTRECLRATRTRCLARLLEPRQGRVWSVNSESDEPAPVRLQGNDHHVGSSVARSMSGHVHTIGNGAAVFASHTAAPLMRNLGRNAAIAAYLPTVAARRCPGRRRGDRPPESRASRRRRAHDEPRHSPRALSSNRRRSGGHAPDRGDFTCGSPNWYSRSSVRRYPSMKVSV